MKGKQTQPGKIIPIRYAIAAMSGLLLFVVLLPIGITLNQEEYDPRSSTTKAKYRVWESQKYLLEKKVAQADFPTAKTPNSDSENFLKVSVKKSTKSPAKPLKQTAPPSPHKPRKILDLDKLAHAVAVAETSNCTGGTGRKLNNCHGIMAWTKSGTRYARTFTTKEESFEEFKKIWAKGYKTFPTLKMAAKWTGNDDPRNWLAIVTENYYQ